MSVGCRNANIYSSTFLCAMVIVMIKITKTNFDDTCRYRIKKYLQLIGIWLNCQCTQAESNDELHARMSAFVLRRVRRIENQIAIFERKWTLSAKQADAKEGRSWAAGFQAAKKKSCIIGESFTRLLPRCGIHSIRNQHTFFFFSLREPLYLWRHFRFILFLWFAISHTAWIAAHYPFAVSLCACVRVSLAADAAIDISVWAILWHYQNVIKYDRRRRHHHHYFV